MCVFLKLEHQIETCSEPVFLAQLRSDIDIVIVAESKAEAMKIIDTLIAKVRKAYGGEVAIFETPCSIQIVGNFPLRHVQIITVLNRTIDEYLLFVDLDCTAMVHDGSKTIACARSVLALQTGRNIVPQSMLQNRSDTPRRLYKYNKRGFASVIPGVLTADSVALLGVAKNISQPTPYLYLDELFDHVHWTNVEAAIAIAEDNRVYSETSLPRGSGVTPAVVSAYFTQVRDKATANGRKLVVHLYSGLPTLVFKHKKMPEKWARWGMLGVLPASGLEMEAVLF